MLKNIFSFFKPRLIVIYLYILFSFIAKPPIMPEVYVTYSLYMVIGYAVFLMITRSTIYWNKYLTWSSSIIALCFVSVLYAHHKEVAFNGIYTLFIPFILAFSFVQLVSTKEDIKNILIVLAISGGILYILMMKHNLFDITERLGNELSGNANAFAGIILLSVMAAICSIYLSKNKLMWVLMIAVIIVDYHMLLLAEGRKYIITPILFAVILSFKASGFKISRLLLLIGIIIVVTPTVIALLFKLDVISDNLITRFEMTSAMLEGQSGMMGDGDIERQKMISYGWRYFLDSPLWGNGQGNFSYLFSLENSGGHIGHYSHNNYVELLCNLGIIGFIMYYIFYYRILRTTFKANTPATNIVFSFVIILMILEFGIVSYYTQYLLQVVICIAGLAVYDRQKMKI